MSENKKYRFNYKNRSKLYKEAVSTLKELAKQESIDMALRAYAEATTDDWKNLFAEEGKARASSGCITQLITGKKCKRRAHEKHDDCFPPSDDHPTLWTREKVAVSYTSELYDLSFEVLKDIINYCEKNNLRADLNYFSSYFPGRTFCVKYTKNES